MQSRFDILKIHSRRMNLMRGIDLKKIAEKMNGASGAELKVCFQIIRCASGYADILLPFRIWLASCE